MSISCGLLWQSSLIQHSSERVHFQLLLKKNQTHNFSNRAIQKSFAEQSGSLTGRFKRPLKKILQNKKTRPGPAQEALKSRAMRVLKQNRMYHGQRDMLYNQTFNLDQVALASEGIKDAQQTMTAQKSANKELKGMMKTVMIQPYHLFY